jgi:uridylate kinase
MSVRIIKLGGSVFSKQNKLIDFAYLLQFKDLLNKYISKGEKYGIVAGGGYTMRMYRDLAQSEGDIQSIEDLHWIGTTTNVLHAEIIRSVFGELAESRPIIYEDYYQTSSLQLTSSVVVGGGGRPGHSGDVDSVLLAKRVGSSEVISLKNIEKLYSADPKVDSSASPIEKATWQEYLDIIGNPTDHTPGGNFPIDPIASRMARELGIRFVVMSGFDLQNFDNYLSNKPFEGSIIY